MDGRTEANLLSKGMALMQTLEAKAVASQTKPSDNSRSAATTRQRGWHEKSWKGNEARQTKQEAATNDSQTVDSRKTR